MDVLMNYITSYGIPVFVIACCIIAVVGTLKLCKVFNKIKSAEVKKVVYYLLDVALAFGGAAIYFAIFKIQFNVQYVVFSCSQVGATTALYAIYENIGIRRFVRYIIQLISKWIIKNPESEFSKWAEKIGVDKAAEALVALKKEQDEKAKAAAEVKPAEAKTDEQTKTISF